MAGLTSYYLCQTFVTWTWPSPFSLSFPFLPFFSLLVLLLSDRVYFEPWPFAPLCVAPPESSPCSSGERTPYALPAKYRRRSDRLVLTLPLTQLQSCASDWRPTLNCLYSGSLFAFLHFALLTVASRISLNRVLAAVMSTLGINSKRLPGALWPNYRDSSGDSKLQSLSLTAFYSVLLFSQRTTQALQKGITVLGFE